MGTNDGGTIGGPKWLLKQRLPYPSFLAVLIVGDGYTSSELSKFDTHAATAVSTLKNEPWFKRNSSLMRLNVARQRVWSTQKAPGTCGKSKKTYFDARFGGSGLCRLLTGNGNLATTTANDAAISLQLPKQFFNVVLVLVNSNKYGGAIEPGLFHGSSIVWVSTGASGWEHVLLHELGHAIGLADEYDYYYACNDAYTHGSGTPVAPNVDGKGNVPKWSTVTTTTLLPTTSNPDCQACDTRWFASHVANGTVGAFEGANHYHCGFVRPQFLCKMRRSDWDFCVVCQEALVKWLT